MRFILMTTALVAFMCGTSFGQQDTMNQSNQSNQSNMSNMSNMSNTTNQTVDNVTGAVSNATGMGAGTVNQTNQSAQGNQTSMGAGMGNDTVATGLTGNPASQANPKNKANQTNQTGGIGAGAAPSLEDTMTLIIQSLDEGQKKVAALNSSDKKVNFTVTDSTPISSGGQAKKFTDLKTGQRIKVTYTGDKNSPNISKIDILSK